MKKSILTVIAVVMAVVASAQTIPSTSAEERARASADYLRSTLSLSEQQYNKVYKAYLKMVRRQDKLFAQQETNRQATERRIKSTLTAEQASQFEQAKDQLQPAPEEVFMPRRTPRSRDAQRIDLPRDPRRSNMRIEKK